MVTKRKPVVEYRVTELVAKADRLRGSKKERVSDISEVDEGKQTNGCSFLFQDLITASGNIISPNGRRLWGMS